MCERTDGSTTHLRYVRRADVGGAISAGQSAGEAAREEGALCHLHGHHVVDLLTNGNSRTASAARSGLSICVVEVQGRDAGLYQRLVYGSTISNVSSWAELQDGDQRP